MRRMAKTIAAGLGTVALAAAVGAGLAHADPEIPAASPSATPSPTDKADRKDRADHIRRHPGLLRRALHGEAHPWRREAAGGGVSAGHCGDGGVKPLSLSRARTDSATATC